VNFAQQKRLGENRLFSRINANIYYFYEIVCLDNDFLHSMANLIMLIVNNSLVCFFFAWNVLFIFADTKSVALNIQ
jgi:hypothetical protein